MMRLEGSNDKGGVEMQTNSPWVKEPVKIEGRDDVVVDVEVK